MYSKESRGFIWPVTEKEGGLPLFFKCSGHHDYLHNRKSRNPEKGDILLFYSNRKIIGFVPVTESSHHTYKADYTRSVGVDFGRKQVFDPPITIDSLVNVCRVLKGKPKARLHDSFQTAPILSFGETQQILEMALGTKKTNPIRRLTPAENADLDEDLTASLKGQSVLPKRLKRVHEIFERNQKVVKKLKAEYDGICQVCGIENLIETDSGFYSEGHHVIPLGEKGYTSYENVIVLCPLCHRKLHYSKDREQLKEMILYSEGHKLLIEQLKRSKQNNS